MFFLIHEGKPDQVIMDCMNLSKRSYARVEESVRAKLLLAIFDCINHRMEGAVALRRPFFAGEEIDCSAIREKWLSAKFQLAGQPFFIVLILFLCLFFRDCNKDQ